ncbi:NAD(P)-dependent oxidoreductase [Telluria beijingensis]|uniref:NAD(P)-dependent oxidoreductase n=1 Tax=Telluria beijingensis TaxID=3068633 RepID=UPI0027955AED|nr:NAD(P)-dependent oxidoreductase [Massilia sp. REN29]
MQTIGLIGAGRMGLPIVGHLARAGYRVLVSERDQARVPDIAARGGEVVDQQLLGAGSEAILVCVGYDREVRELLQAPGALLAAARPGTIVAVLSTIHPKTMQELAAHAAAQGVHVVDSTVCRGGRAADEGTLLSFVGGDAEVVERLTPVLRAYSSDVVHSGGVGTAQVSKAVNNLILWACLVASHEGLALAQRYQVDVEALRAALMTSSATNGALGNWGGQSMAWAEDDMEIVAAMAADCGIALPQSGLVREVCRGLKPRRYQLEKYGT